MDNLVDETDQTLEDLAKKAGVELDKVDSAIQNSSKAVEGGSNLSNYRTVVTNEDITVYRSFGYNADAGGAFVTSSSTLNRVQTKVDSAILPEWKNTLKYEAEIVIPKDYFAYRTSGRTVYNEGLLVILTNFCYKKIGI